MDFFFCVYRALGAVSDCLFVFVFYFKPTLYLQDPRTTSTAVPFKKKKRKEKKDLRRLQSGRHFVEGKDECGGGPTVLSPLHTDCYFVVTVIAL